MAVKIRLSRTGKKNRPFCRIVAMDSQKKRDGASLENLGSYDPVTHAVLQINVEKIEQWIAKGAICTPAVEKILKSKKTVVTKTKSA